MKWGKVLCSVVDMGVGMRVWKGGTWSARAGSGGVAADVALSTALVCTDADVALSTALVCTDADVASSAAL
eukprot:185989-Chlamydomonas_euryale.AAC.1